MSTIITFYSYKGGVGRSMALANIAVLMAKRGLKVLVVDWDLEAPGLERYFSYFEQTAKTGGLLPFFTEVADQMGRDSKLPRYQNHIWKIEVDENHSLSLIPSGRDSHAHYATMLDQFDWRRFFSDGGGDFIERLRDEWRKDFDFILVDSRTGMSDIGGICTIQIPDVLVAMFTANEQSMLGVRDIIQAAQRGRQHLAYDRMPLTVLPIVSRFSSASELQTSLSWLDRIAEQFSFCCEDWLPQWIPPRAVFERLKIPQVDWFSFGERLAVVEQGTTDPSSMGFALDRITDLLASDFDDIEAVFGSAAHRPSNWKRPERLKAFEKATTINDDYEYDLFVSYHGGGALGEWTKEFVNDLKDWLSLELSKEPKVFLDAINTSVDDDWKVHTKRAIKRSKIFIAILTPAYFTSNSCIEEWLLFEAREQIMKKSLIVPILVRGGHGTLPKSIFKRQYLDATKIFSPEGRNSHRGSSPEYSMFLKEASNNINKMLKKIKPYSSKLDDGISDIILDNLRKKYAQPELYAEDSLLAYFQESHEKYLALIKERSLKLPDHGTWEVALHILGDVPLHKTDTNFLSLLDSNNPKFTGWPVWLISRNFNDKTSRPFVINGEWEALVDSTVNGSTPHIDFMRYDPKGRFYLRRALEDDISSSKRAPAPLKALDFGLPIIRVAEALAVGLAFATAMGCSPEETKLAYSFKWTRLRGRTLTSWAQPERYISSDRSAYQDEVVTYANLPLETSLSAMSEYVNQCIQPLFQIFDGFELDAQIVDDLTRRLIERRL
jgi:cellulose biosynthesis protein BcsQ